MFACSVHGPSGSGRTVGPGAYMPGKRPNEQVLYGQGLHVRSSLCPYEGLH